MVLLSSMLLLHFCSRNKEIQLKGDFEYMQFKKDNCSENLRHEIIPLDNSNVQVDACFLADFL